jgi:hypothetical protein
MFKINNIKEGIVNKRMAKLRNKSIHQGAANLYDNLSIFHESPVTDTANTGVNMVSSKLYSRNKGNVHALEEYITRKSSNTKVRYKDMVMVYSPYSYTKIDSFYNAESYFSRSVTRQVETTMRNGFKFVSDSMELSNVVKNEFTHMQYISGRPLSSMIARFISDVLKYGITIIEKVYKNVDKEQRLYNLRSIKPHKSCFYVDPTGIVKGAYDQNVSKVRHMYTFNKVYTSMIPASSIAYGTIIDTGADIYPAPPCFQMLNDILSLRSLEETVELVGFQFGSPLLHAKVGSDEAPALSNDVTDVHNNIVEMAPNGMITTDHRVNIEVLNLQGGIPDLMPYIAHFKNRVLVGSGSSPISVGELDTSNRATSESMDTAMSDHCTYVANIVCDIFNYNIIPSILLSSGYTFEEILDDTGEMAVRLEFNEMDIDKLIAKANNIINIYQSNLITLHEARRRLKEIPLNKLDEVYLYLNQVQIPLALSKKAIGGIDNKVTALNQPSNQHGTKSGPGSSKDNEPE